MVNVTDTENESGASLEERMDEEKLANEALPKMAPLLRKMADICEGENPSEGLKTLAEGFTEDSHEAAKEHSETPDMEYDDPAREANFEAYNRINETLGSIQNVLNMATKSRPGISFLEKRVGS